MKINDTTLSRATEVEKLMDEKFVLGLATRKALKVLGRFMSVR